MIGLVVKKCGPVNYEVSVQGRVRKRRADQMMEYKGQLEKQGRNLGIPADTGVGRTYLEVR